MSPFQAPSPRFGVPSYFDFNWDKFIEVTIALTLEAYEEMRRDRVAQRGWDEETFALQLGENYIHKLGVAYAINVECESRQYTAQMLAGAVSPKYAPRIDIRLYSEWEREHHKNYFSWECKKVSDKRVDPRHKGLVGEYIKEGILRFIEEEYSAGLANGGMLGIVLAGEIENIVSDINSSMIGRRRERRLSGGDQLYKDAPRSTFNDIYWSQHERNDGSIIKLHHLFLAFDFD